MGQQAYQADLGEWMQTLQLDQVEPKPICTSVLSCIGYQPLWAFAENGSNLAYLPGLLWNSEMQSFAWYQAGGRFVYKLLQCELLLIHCDHSGNLPLCPPENCPSHFYKFPECPRDVAWRTHTYQISELVYFWVPRLKNASSYERAGSQSLVAFCFQKPPKSWKALVPTTAPFLVFWVLRTALLDLSWCLACHLSSINLGSTLSGRGSIYHRSQF